MSGEKGMMHYTKEIKQEEVWLFLEEHHTYARIAEKLKIRKAKRIEVWMQIYRREGEESFHKPIGRPPQTEAAQRALFRLTRIGLQ